MGADRVRGYDHVKRPASTLGGMLSVLKWALSDSCRSMRRLGERRSKSPSRSLVTVMGAKVRTAVKESGKSSLAPQRAKGAFEPQGCVVQRKEAPMPDAAQPVEAQPGPGELLDAYLEREARLEGAREVGVGVEKVLQGRSVGGDGPVQLKPRDEAGKAENRTGMPDRLKEGLEGLSGLDLSGVRVHYNSAKPAEVGALAYARGQEIHLGPGQEGSLPHEGWHVVQQMEGRVRPTLREGGLGINDDVGLEREAEVMGARASERKADVTGAKTLQTTAHDFSSTLLQMEAQLMQQTGPSCWLFVLEGLAKEEGLGTRWLSTAMQAYPSSEEALEELSKMEGIEGARKRMAALRLMAKRLEKFVSILESYRDKGGTDQNSQLTLPRDKAETFSLRAGVYEALQKYLKHDSVKEGSLVTKDVIGDFTEAAKRARTLYETVYGARKKGDEVQALLGGEGVSFSTDSAISDIHTTLKIVGVPAYASIRARFKLRTDDSPDADQDYTDRSIDEMAPTAHAVLITAYDQAKKIVTYKDPNYGNIRIRIRIGQLRAMAGTEMVTLRNLIKGGQKPSKLKDVKD